MIGKQDADRTELLGFYCVVGAFAFVGIGGLVQLLSSSDDAAVAASTPGGLLLAVRGTLQLKSAPYRERLLDRGQRTPAKQYPRPTAPGSLVLVVLGLGWAAVGLGQLALA